MSTASAIAPAPRLKKFLQIHTLASYPAALLNRDDQGSAKRIAFGSGPRIRVSSQAAKKHWRDALQEQGFSEIGENALRSRYSFENRIVEPLIQKGVSPEIARITGQCLLDQVNGASAEKQAGRKKVPVVMSAQVLTMGPGELQILANIASEAAKTTDPNAIPGRIAELLTPERRKELKARGANIGGADTALFGRMILGDMVSQYDAAVHVAHPFSVHADATENDYFTATDDLALDMDLATSAHLGTTELAASILYGHVTVDLPLLTSNLTGCDQDVWNAGDLDITKKAVSALIRAISTVSLGAKKGSTAPYTYADVVMIELGWAQPTSHCNAYLDPVPRRGDMLGEAALRLAKRANEMTRIYQQGSIIRKFIGTEKTLSMTNGDGAPLDPALRAKSMTDLLAWVVGEIGH